MHNILNQAEIGRAKRELKLRRAEMLKRHAEEIRWLNAEEAALQRLERLMSALPDEHAADKSSEAVAERAAPIVVASMPSAKPSPPRPKYQATNFELFARASAYGTF